MKLTTNTNVSVDGVMQGLGGPEEDRRGGFERGGWAMPYFDSETAALIGEVYQRGDAFLFGRRTYETFAGSWGANEGDNPISVALNTRPKYVASSTLTDPQWADTIVLSGDVAAAVGELKAKPGASFRWSVASVWSGCCSTTSWSTRSPCSPSPCSSARAGGCSPTPARTWRSSWSSRAPPPAG
jgi:dihydrofolate reductase